MLVRDDVAEGDVMPAHEVCGEAGGAIKGGGAGVSSVFAHFDADGFSITGAVIVGVLALFISGE